MSDFREEPPWDFQEIPPPKSYSFYASDDDYGLPPSHILGSTTISSNYEAARTESQEKASPPAGEIIREESSDSHTEKDGEPEHARTHMREMKAEDEKLPTKKRINLRVLYALHPVPPRICSELLRHLTASHPLPEALQHLKRVKSHSLSDDTDGTKASSQLQVLLGESPELTHPVADLLKDLPVKTTRVEVPAYPAGNIEEMRASLCYWPVIYKRPSWEPLTLRDDEKREMINFLRFAKKVACHKLSGGSGCIITLNGVPMSFAWDCKKRNPMHHAAILAIENFSKRLRSLNKKESDATLSVIKKVPKLDSFKELLSKQEASISKDMLALENSVNASSLPCDQYLCTGGDAYLSHEPCIMCAMALIHSRIKRIIYEVKDYTNGGFGGRFHIHHNKNLNHHCRVFVVVIRGQRENKP